MQADLRIDARWVLPLGDNNEVFENYSVYITDGRIVGLQPQSELGPEVKEHIKLEEHALLPGYINAHGHAAMSLFRGLADDRPLMTWLQDHIWPAEAQWVSGDFVYQGTQLAIAEMLRCGTTTFAVRTTDPAETLTLTLTDDGATLAAPAKCSPIDARLATP